MYPIYFTTDVNSSALRTHAITRVSVSKTWFTMPPEQESELVSSNVASLSWGSTQKWHYYAAQHPMDGKDSRCLPFHNGCLEGFCGWSKSLKLVQVFVGKYWTEQQCGYSLTSYCTSSSECATVTFRPRRHCLWGHGATTYAGSCSDEIYSSLNGYPQRLMRDYIVTPAAAGNGSATLGTCLLNKWAKIKNKRPLSNRVDDNWAETDLSRSFHKSTKKWEGMKKYCKG